MVGITSFGVHLPVYRLSRDTVARVWQSRSLGGERAVAGHDEDSLTMAVNAAHHCVARANGNVLIQGVLFASTTSPYKEKQAGATVAATLDLPSNTYTADITGSLRGATIAMNLATGMIKGEMAENVIISASDCRLGMPQSDQEQRFGDVAAAVMMGNSNLIAEVPASYSVYDEFIDYWRFENDVFVRSWEERFTILQGYMRVLKRSVSDFLEKEGMKPNHFNKVILCGPDPQSQMGLAKSLGFDPKTQLVQPLFSRVGHGGSAEPLLMLCGALEQANKGDRILFTTYGDGSDLFILEVTDNIKRLQDGRGLKGQLARRLEINYEKYLSWRNLLPIWLPRRPAPEMRSVTSRWRERKRILALNGAKCRNCGTIQYPPQRVCVNCGKKDDFDDYSFIGRKARVFTFATDRLSPTKAPPAMNAFVEFEGGGRMVAELTDCESETLKIGMPVEMTFRKMHQFAEMTDYFWKARPLYKNEQD